MVSLARDPPETGGERQPPTPPRPEVARAAVVTVGTNGGAPRNPYQTTKRTRERPLPLLPAVLGREEEDVATLNPGPRQRQRKGTGKGRCCNCNRSSACTNAPQSRCECRRADPPRPCTSCPCSRTCTNAMTPLSEGTINRRQGLMNFAFSRGPVALAAAAATCTNAITPQAIGDPTPPTIEEGRGEDEVVPPLMPLRCRWV